MNIERAIEKAKEIMVNAGKFYAEEKAMKVYTSEIHQQSAALAMRAVLAPKPLADGTVDKLELTTANLAELIKKLTNHSQWRQVMEEKKVFAKRDKTSVDTQISELEEEMGE